MILVMFFFLLNFGGVFCKFIVEFELFLWNNVDFRGVNFVLNKKKIYIGVRILCFFVLFFFNFL